MKTKKYRPSKMTKRKINLHSRTIKLLKNVGFMFKNGKKIISDEQTEKMDQNSILSDNTGGSDKKQSIGKHLSSSCSSESGNKKTKNGTEEEKLLHKQSNDDIVFDETIQHEYKNDKMYLMDIFGMTVDLNTFLYSDKSKASTLYQKALYDYHQKKLNSMKIDKRVLECDIPQNYSLYKQYKQQKTNFYRKISVLCLKELKRALQRTNKTNPVLKSRRILKSLSKKEKSQKILRSKKNELILEKKQEKMKLEYLLKQTELFSYFIQKNDKKEMARMRSVLEQPTEDQKDVAPENGVSIEPEGTINQKYKQMQNQLNSNDTCKDSVERNNIAVYENETICPDLCHFNGTLHDYQRKGVSWLINLYNNNINGILADDMGLGKTIQSIFFINWLIEKKHKSVFLIVSPISTIGNWENEIKRFCPIIEVNTFVGGDRALPIISKRRYQDENLDEEILKQVNSKDKNSKYKNFKQENESLTGGQTEDKKLKKDESDKKRRRKSDNTGPLIILTSYNLLNDKKLKKIQFDYLICDEAQAIKSNKSLRWKNINNIISKNRLLLTGTPIQNNLMELWSLLHFIMPTLFNDASIFLNFFSNAKSDSTNNDPEQNSVRNSDNLEQNNTKNLDNLESAEIIPTEDKPPENKVESKAEDKKPIRSVIIKEENTQSLERLHLILKPFMLRREKKDVKNELGVKTEKEIHCNMINYQEKLYKKIEGKKEENTIMQLRKIVNHPYLYTRDKIGTGLILENEQPIYHCTDDLISRLEGNVLLKNRTMAMKLNELVDKKLLNSQDSFVKISKNNIVKDIKWNNIVNIQDNFSISINESLVSKEESERKLTTGQALFKTESNLLTESEIRQPMDIKSVSFDGEIKKQRTAFENELLERNQFIESIIGQEEPNRFIKKFFDDCVPRVSDTVNSRTNSVNLVRIPPFSLFDSGKFRVLDKMLKQMCQENIKNMKEKNKMKNRVLIYFQMTRMMDLFEEYCKETNFSYVRLDGQLKLQERKKIVDVFQNQEIFLFMLSTRAGGLGLNLTKANVVIFYDSDWNPTVDQQAMDRAYRLGNKEDVTVYRLITKGTVEEKMRDSAEYKEEIHRLVIDGGEYGA
ncbi:transcriptional activator [Pseudoloma neurophilia]|uniref:Chromatin-remodeling ATPase INO80 n=1 Tax=Pseudoloma neurophilia TaxID=146866 RepID=A0A0R0LWB5_9MICR|nr:transcriptional activator [Pseudoloma neurophilia]